MLLVNATERVWLLTYNSRLVILKHLFKTNTVATVVAELVVMTAVQIISVVELGLVTAVQIKMVAKLVLIAEV